MDTSITEDAVAAVPEAPAAAPSAPDPFALDEAKFVALSPEQRAAIDPVLQEWKTRAKAELEKTGKTYEEKYKPYQEKAQALDQLVQDQRFVQWWQSVQKAATVQNPQGADAIQQSKPQDFATENEWQEAWGNAYGGDYTKFKEIQARMFAAMATPVVQQLKEGQEELRTTLEMKDLFDRHQDARDLDSIGRNLSDPNDKSLSLLEMALNWATDNRRPLEEGYRLARKWADSLKVGAQQQAMGLVQSKKEGVTSGPTTHQGGPAVVEVGSMDELMSKRMEYALSGEKAPRFVIRPSESNSTTRWAQRT